MELIKNLKSDGNGNRSKYFIDGMSLYRYCKCHQLGKAEYSRCLYLIREKCFSPEEALKYHRIANPNNKLIRKINQRMRYGIDEKYLNLSSRFIIEMGYDKQSKYKYKGSRISVWCKKKGISVGTVYSRMYKYGLTVGDAITMSRKDLIYYIKKAISITGKAKNAGKIIKYDKRLNGEKVTK